MQSRPVRELTIGIAGALLVAAALSGCGGGGGGGGLPRPVDPTPALPLPSGHGLGAGVITLAAGEVEERGNVVFTCPAGGSACVVTVSADGTAVYDRMGGVPGVTAAYGSWGLPSGHGLRAGVITVAAGTSEEHGNVVVTCPPGGNACVVRVSADGATKYARTGGIPTFVFSHPAYERDNSTAEDLLDHWNEPERLRTALGLSAVAAGNIAGRKRTLTDLINAAGGDSAGTRTLLRNVSPDGVEVIGERDGITYGRWRGGPAGTLNIEFDWRFGRNFDPETRARMERAGKSWSWRIRDDFGTNLAPRGSELVDHPSTGRLVLGEDLTADDVLIFVVDMGDARASSAGPKYRNEMNDDYEPWLGLLYLSQRHVDFTGTMAHEIGHVIGVSGWAIQPLTRYINRADHTFEGPEAMRENGGQPVPFQWVDADNRVVPPNTAGARVDYGHLGVCTSIMAYCSDGREVYVPAEIDFAYLHDLGYEILDAQTASEPELYGYGAWGRYSAWGAGVERTIEYERGRTVEATDTLRAAADAFGMAPGMGLAEAHAPLQGGITWSGSLVGVDLGQNMLSPVFGDAELRVDLSTLRGAATFDDLTVHVDGVSSVFRTPRLEYDIEVAGNAFSDEDGRVLGGFYGPAHEEMAGVLDDRTADVNLLAGFGGTR